MSARSFPEPSRVDAPFRLSVDYARAGLLVGRIGPVCLAIWRTKPVMELFEVQRLDLAAAVANDPGRVAFLCVVETSADPPDQTVRDASAAMMASFGKNLAACACVIEGTGFRAAITRTVLAGMQFVARSTTPTRFFEHVSESSSWLVERLGRGSALDLTNEVEFGRKRLDAAP